MAITAQSIIRRVVETLQDNTSVRWPINQLVRFLNDGQREICMYRKDAMSKNATVTLVAGTRQALPADGTNLIEPIRNNSTASKRAVRIVNREILDAQLPGWHSISGVSEILHVIYDVREPKVFYVYPPALATGAALDIVYSAVPADVAEPADGTTYTAVTGDISVPDVYANALQDYILYRAYSKDSEYAGNTSRATTNYAAFANSLGIEIKAALAAGPSQAGNPNRTATAVAG